MNERVLTIKRNKAGDLIMNYDASRLRMPLIHGLGRATRRTVRTLLWLDGLRRYRLVFTSAIGLGVGVSLSWFVYSYPMPTIAFPHLVGTTRSQTTYVSARFSPQGGWLKVVSSSGHPSYVALTHGAAKEAVWLQLGDRVELLGQNNGVYRFTIVEIRYMQTAELSQLGDHPQDSTILHIPSNLLETEQLVLVLK